MTTTKKNLVLVLLALGAAFAIVAYVSSVPAHAQVDGSQNCTTLTLVSTTTTQTAGWTAGPIADATAGLNTANYSPGTFAPATPTEYESLWINPATNSDFSGSGAVWVSTGPTWPGGSGNTEGTPGQDQWRLFKDSFTLPADATVTGATLWYTADNATAVYLDGNATEIADNGLVYGTSPGATPYNFETVSSTPFTPVAGANTLEFVVRNWGGNFNPNPTGLLYKAVVDYCVPATGSIVVTKQVTNYPVSTTFTLNYSGPASGTATVAAYKFHDGTATIADLPPGTYAVTEVVPPGWVENTTSCNSVVVTAGQTATCTIKNTKTSSNVHVTNSNVSFVTNTTSSNSNTGGNSVGSFGGAGADANNYSYANGNGGNGSSNTGSVTTGAASSHSFTFNGVNLNFTHVFSF